MRGFPSSALRRLAWAIPAAAIACGWAGAAAAQDAPGAPAADDCITNISATAPGQARTVQCRGDAVTFFVAVPPACTRGGCGLIVDLPGATQTAASVNMNTGLRQRAAAAAKPFIVINAQHNQANGTPVFDTRFRQGDDEVIFRFVQRAAKVFAVDPKRIHMGGFSQGGILTFDVICDPAKAAILASVAPAAAFPEQGGQTCFGPGRSNPTLPILFISGRQDRIAPFQRQASAAQDIIAGRQPIMTTEDLDNGASGFVQTRIIGMNGQILELIRHDNTNAGLGGHCFVGPAVQNGGACNGPNGFEDGAKILEFYTENPKD